MKERIGFIFLLFISTIARVWRLGEIPAGLSLKEVEFGLQLSKYFGNWVLDPVVVRTPFVILGLVSLAVGYVLLHKLTKNFWLSYLTILLFSISAWHIQQSRVYSAGMVIFIMIMIVVLVGYNLGFTNTRLLKATLFVSALALLASVALIPKDIKGQVDQERALAGNLGIGGFSRAFSNKYIASYRYGEKILFENLDFGNYFFSGHPRERWGVEETQKIFVTLLPLIFISLFVIKKKQLWMPASIGLLAIIYAVLFKLRGPSATLTLILPLSMLAAIGSLVLYKGGILRKSILATLTLVFIYELINFQMLYFSGKGVSEFSPRRPVYSALATVVEQNVANEKEFYVSPRLDDFNEYLKFYLGGELPKNMEIKEFNYKVDGHKGRIFVEVLPNDPLPDEPLYTQTGDLPTDIEAISILDDFNKRQKIVVFRQI
jgi:hypothetical protein